MPEATCVDTTLTLLQPPLGENPAILNAERGLATPPPAAQRRPALSRRLVFGLAAAAVPIAAEAKAAAIEALPTVEPSLPGEAGWRRARREAVRCDDAVRRARTALEARIGPRGAVIGLLTLASGRTVQIRVTTSEQAKRLWRRLNLGPKLDSERVALLADLRAACERWDAEARRVGLVELERQAASARARAATAMRGLSGTKT